ncbi:hypothetical protein EST38_g3362 [Candolleomyces aberdarensis]|uniref:Fe2OG dioxygenase domain-containing protein n=1 Tax=Candolleomyces aberdarensis TaxID=2316362 RepID=A0A4Q2DSE4_9AGAR|nr:hypothetical protein EST38_g3362 [Candolleomyces aberdarensis]
MSRDLSNVYTDDLALRKELVARVRDACIRVGFFYVSNHGIPENTIANSLDAAKRFFALPLDTKMEIENKKQPNFKGYSPLLSGNNDPYGKGDLQEGFEFGWEDLDSSAKSHDESAQGVMAGANVWPSEDSVSGFRDAALSYYHAATKLGKALFPLFAEALDQPPNFFQDKTLHSAALMKLLYYPPQTGPVDDRVIGIGAHTDWECFTILWQQPGIQALQVLNSEKQWINAPPIEGTLVINLGDEFARLTNGIFKSTVHRAINRNGVERYSIPLFFGIDYNAKLEVGQTFDPFTNVPVIDLSNVYTDNPALRKELVTRVRDACIRVGFFYVSNHGIPEGTISNAMDAAKRFFALPFDTKMEIESKKQPNFKGYSPLLGGNNDPEGFEFGWEDLQTSIESHDESTQGVMAGANVWPSEDLVSGFRNAALSYYHAATKLGKALFSLFAEALDQPSNFFQDKTLDSAALMKLLYYRPQTGPVGERVVGIGAHTDWECFTILWQQPGIQALQLLNSEKRWIDAPPIEGTLVINLGDEFARLTNDIFKPTIHRVFNKNGVERYSIPLFFGIDYNAKLEPMPNCVSPERPFAYEVITAGEYIKSRFTAMYNHK